MPKDTFYNLSDEKKRKIFDAAVQEFSARRFGEASINQIIKAAGIPRGSFYQYFEDKEDLYLYMFAEIGAEKQAVIGQVEALNPEADFFEAYQHNMKILLEWSKKKPEYNQLGLLMEMDDSEFINKLRGVTNQYFARMSELIERDKRRGLIKPETNSEVVVDMIYSINMHYIKEYYRTGSVEDMLRKINEVMKTIKDGIIIR
ncbi:MAG: regulatory protein TetR [Clostridia bacterium]|nr:regulatory protein TetR [Clostridia bacterium]